MSDSVRLQIIINNKIAKKIKKDAKKNKMNVSKFLREMLTELYA